jgi:hypothetical protein
MSAAGTANANGDVAAVGVKNGFKPTVKKAV